jgi:hypothetical protein
LIKDISLLCLNGSSVEKISGFRKQGEEKSFISGTKRKKKHNIKIAIPYNLNKLKIQRHV